MSHTDFYIPIYLNYTKHLRLKGVTSGNGNLQNKRNNSGGGCLLPRILCPALSLSLPSLMWMPFDRMHGPSKKSQQRQSFTS